MRDVERAVSKVAERILVIRRRRVILDRDLALLYGVQAKRFNEQVRRNLRKFPPDFMFELTNQEFAILRSQFATSSWGGRRYAPLAFTEHGAIMAATLLNSPRAIEISVYVVRAFIGMREALAASRGMGKRLEKLENEIATHERAIVQIFEALRGPSEPVAQPRRRIGFL